MYWREPGRTLRVCTWTRRSRPSPQTHLSQIMLGVPQKVFSWVLLSCYYAWTVHSATSARVLVYTATAGFRHDSIPTSLDALHKAGPSINVVFDNTEDPKQFNDQNLANYDALMFVSTTGEGALCIFRVSL